MIEPIKGCFSIGKITCLGTKDVDDSQISQARISKYGKLLKVIFQKGPSKAVLSYGKIVIASSEASPEGSSNKEQENKEEIKDSYNYSILESYLCNKNIFEKSVNTDNTPNAVGTKQDNKERDSQVSPFYVGPSFDVYVVLPNEGYSKWHLVLDDRVKDRENSVQNAIKSKAFKKAYQIASDGLSSDGLVAVSVETFINPKAPCKCPFIGNCRFAFDSGSEDSNEDSSSVTLAIAPIDMATGKPKESTVFRVDYDIVGDISNGSLAIINSIISKDDNKSKYDYFSKGTDSSEIDDEISKFLNKKFKCIGDSSMYKNFLEIRKYIESQLNAKNLEFDSSESTEIKNFCKNPNVEKSLIVY